MVHSRKIAFNAEFGDLHRLFRYSTGLPERKSVFCVSLYKVCSLFPELHVRLAVKLTQHQQRLVV